MGNTQSGVRLMQASPPEIPPAEALQQGLTMFYAQPPDHAAAVGFFRAAAEAGSNEGLAMLGLCLLEGLGLTSDPVQARELLEKAAAKGSRTARFQLGRALVTGRGGPVDERRGLAAYLSAAAMGHAEAMFNLASCLHAGVGCLPDRLAAKALYLRARTLGCALQPRGVVVHQRDLKAVRALARRFEDPDRLLVLVRDRQQRLTLMHEAARPALGPIQSTGAGRSAKQPRPRLGALALGVMAALAGTVGELLRARSPDAGPTTLPR